MIKKTFFFFISSFLYVLFLYIFLIIFIIIFFLRFIYNSLTIKIELNLNSMISQFIYEKNDVIPFDKQNWYSNKLS